MDVWAITVALSIDTSVVSTKELRKTTNQLAVYKRGRGFEQGTTESKSSSHYSCLRAQIHGKKKAQPASGRLDYCRNTLALI